MSADTTPQSLRICVPIPHRQRGGMYTFLENWRSWLSAQGIWHTPDYRDEYDVLFVNSFMVPVSLIQTVKQSRAHVRVVQRVDGSTRDYGRGDDGDDRQARVNMWTDLTIFQSEYSKLSTRHKFKVIRQDGPVIYNAVDTELFRPQAAGNRPGDPVRVCNASFSLNPKKGAWRIGRLAQQHPEVEFVLCGRYPELPKTPNIKLLGMLGRSKIAAAMRSCDVYLHPAENDPCPNVVLEALASGLPVLYTDSGGTPELVGSCGLPVTLGDFAGKLQAILARHEAFSRCARERATERFSPDRIFPRYLQAIVGAERRPLPSWKERIKATLAGYPIVPHTPRQVYWFGKRWLSEHILRRSPLGPHE